MPKTREGAKLQLAKEQIKNYISSKHSTHRMAPMAKKAPRRQSVSVAAKRTYLKQSDVPSASLADALRMPQAIMDHYAGKPASPLQVAKALNVDPKGSQLRVLSGAAIAFGLVEGGAQAASISLTDLARRILRPREDNEDVAAKREAVLRPRVFGDFLRQYDGHPFPRQDIALNVIEAMGVPRDKVEEVLERIDASARSVGFMEEIKGKSYVTLQGTVATASESAEDAEVEESIIEDEIETEVIHRTPAAAPVIQPRGRH